MTPNEESAAQNEVEKAEVKVEPSKIAPNESCQTHSNNTVMEVPPQEGKWLISSLDMWPPQTVTSMTRLY